MNTKLRKVKLTKGTNPITLHDDMSKIKAKLIQARLMCSKSDVNASAIRALSVEYQSTINYACLEARINHINLGDKMYV